jgi:hypothetical protein
MKHDQRRSVDVSVTIPDQLPSLGQGSHHPWSSTPCAMEAASWIAGHRWSDHPRSVHPAIAGVARMVNDSLSDDERQGLWPLILASVDTARPWRPILSWRLHRYAVIAMRAAGGPTTAVWRGTLDRFAELTKVELSTGSLLDAQAQARTLLSAQLPR